MKELLSNVGAGGAAPAAGAAPGAAAGGVAAAEAPKEEEKKEEEKEESDDDMVRPLLLSARLRAGFADWVCVCVPLRAGLRSVRLSASSVGWLRLSLSLWCLSYRIAASRTPSRCPPIALYYPYPIYYACQKL